MLATTCGSHQFATAVGAGAGGASPCAQPAIGDVAGAATIATTGALSDATGPLVLHTPAGLGYAFIQNQTYAGSTPGNLSGSYFGLNDVATSSGPYGAYGWNFAHVMGGAAAGTAASALQGNRSSMAIGATWNAPDNGQTSNPNIVTLFPTMNVDAGDGGTSAASLTSGSRGAFFAVNTVTTANNAQNLQTLTGVEDDISCASTCSTAYKIGHSIVELSTDATQGTVADIGLDISAAAPTAVGWRNVIQVGGANGGYPYNAGSTIFSMPGSGSATDGIDLSGTWTAAGGPTTGTQFSGCAYRFKDFCIDNNASLTAPSAAIATLTVLKSLSLGTTSSLLTFPGSSGTFKSAATNGSGGDIQFSQGQMYFDNYENGYVFRDKSGHILLNLYDGAAVSLYPVTAPSYQETLTTPSSSSAKCTTGQFTDDASYHYVCVDTNKWRRVALSDF